MYDIIDLSVKGENLLKLNKSCKTCIHDVICKDKGVRPLYEETVKSFYECLNEEFGTSFNLIMECINHDQYPIGIRGLSGSVGQGYLGSDSVD